MSHTLVPIQSIDVPADHRKVSQDAAHALSENIDKIGLRQPIEVISSGDGRFRLVFGATRLAAFGILGQTAIPAIVRQQDEFADESAIRLTTISENIYRRDLSILDRSVDIADWCAIWRATRPAVKPGPKPAKGKAGELSVNLILNSSDDEKLEISDSFALAFSDAAQRFLGISRSAVFRAIKIAGIPFDLRERIALSALADNQQDLLALAVEPYERAARIIGIILDGEAANVFGAIGIIDQRPSEEPRAPWEKVADRFSRLRPPEQDSFFALHEAAVMRWVAERKARR